MCHPKKGFLVKKEKRKSSPKNRGDSFGNTCRETCFPFLLGHFERCDPHKPPGFSEPLSSNLETKWGLGLSHQASQKYPEPLWGHRETGFIQSHSQINAWCMLCHSGTQAPVGTGGNCRWHLGEGVSVPILCCKVPLSPRFFLRLSENTRHIQGACSSLASVYPTIRRMSCSQNHHPQSHQMAHGRKVGSAQRTDDKWQAPDVLQ